MNVNNSSLNTNEKQQIVRNINDLFSTYHGQLSRGCHRSISMQMIGLIAKTKAKLVYKQLMILGVDVDEAITCINNQLTVDITDNFGRFTYKPNFVKAELL